LRTVARVFGLHPVVLENAVNVLQRAKSELYDQHQLIIARTPQIGDDDSASA